MIATIVDLRYRMKDVLKAISINEEVIVTYRGKEIATIRSIKNKKSNKKAKDHSLFGITKSIPRRNLKREILTKKKHIKKSKKYDKIKLPSYF